MGIMDKDNAIEIWESVIEPNENKNKHRGYIDVIYDFQNRNGASAEYSSSVCPACLNIDSLCDEYFRITDTNRKTEIIEELLLREINVYKLLKLIESFGSVDSNITKINDINHYLSNNKYTITELEEMKVIDPNINNVRIEFARWCPICYARKPDIITK